MLFFFGGIFSCWLVVFCAIRKLEFCWYLRCFVLSDIERMKHVTTQQKNQPLIYHSLMRGFAGSMTFSYYASQLEFDCFFLQMDVSENSGTPKSSILIGFSIINHPFWGTPIFGNTQIARLKQHEHLALHLKISA